MANPLDSAITQHLMNVKAGLPGGMLPPFMTGLPTAPLFGAPGMMPTMLPPLGMGTFPPPGMAPPPPLSGPAPPVILPPTGLLSVAVDNLPFRYSLSEQDLREMFQRWGSLQSVQVSRGGPREIGVVTFEDPIDAADAKRQLHGFAVTLEGAAATLVVVHGGPDQLGGPPPAPGGGDGRPGTVPSGAVPKSGPALPPAMPRPVWCCKILLQADRLHREFPVAAKVLGQGNANVDHLRSQTRCDVHLRGLGSGLIEASGTELQEPMFLWLASDSEQSGKAGLSLAQDLLKSVYDEHHSWCTKHSLEFDRVSEPLIFENPAELPPPVTQVG